MHHIHTAAALRHHVSRTAVHAWGYLCLQDTMVAAMLLLLWRLPLAELLCKAADAYSDERLSHLSM